MVYYVTGYSNVTLHMEVKANSEVQAKNRVKLIRPDAKVLYVTDDLIPMPPDYIRNMHAMNATGL